MARRKGKTARRHRGEGSTRWREDRQLWEHRIWITPPDGGEPRRTSVYARSSAELVEKVSEIRGAPPPKIDASAAPMSVGKMLNDWLTSIEPGNRSIGRRAGLRQGTWERYENIVRIHLRPLHHIALRRLTTEQIDTMLRGVKGSPRTREMTGQVLRTALNWAVRRELLQRNPASEARLPEVRRRPVPAFTTADVARILSAVRGHPLEALFVLALMTGARQGELLALTRDDVFLEPNDPRPGAPKVPSIVINKTLTWRSDGRPGLSPVKTASAGGAGDRRTVPLGKISIEALQRHELRVARSGVLPMETWDRAEKSIRARRSAAGDDPDRPVAKYPRRGWNPREMDLVFVTPTGQPIRAGSSRGPLAQWKQIVREHGLPKMTFHDLRHVAASMMLQATGGNLFEVAQILGHADTRMLQKTYGHLLGHGRGAIENLEKLVAGAQRSQKRAPKRANTRRNRAPAGVLGGTKRPK